jgi:signal transduction histidine kinase
VRLLAPPLPPRAATALDALERALEDLSRRLSALAAVSGAAGGARTLALAPLLRDLLAAFGPPPGVAVRASLAEVSARADDRALRAALRELLRSAAAAPGPGGAIFLSLAVRAGVPVVEIACGAARGDGAAALARALVGPHGGRVEEEPEAGGGRTLRVVLARADVSSQLSAIS